MYILIHEHDQLSQNKIFIKYKRKEKSIKITDFKKNQASTTNNKSDSICSEETQRYLFTI